MLRKTATASLIALLLMLSSTSIYAMGVDTTGGSNSTEIGSVIREYYDKNEAVRQAIQQQAALNIYRQVNIGDSSELKGSLLYMVLDSATKKQSENSENQNGSFSGNIINKNGEEVNSQQIGGAVVVAKGNESRGVWQTVMPGWDGSKGVLRVLLNTDPKFPYANDAIRAQVIAETATGWRIDKIQFDGREVSNKEWITLGENIPEGTYFDKHSYVVLATNGVQSAWFAAKISYKVEKMVSTSRGDEKNSDIYTENGVNSISAVDANKDIMTANADSKVAKRPILDGTLRDVKDENGQLWATLKESTGNTIRLKFPSKKGLNFKDGDAIEVTGPIRQDSSGIYMDVSSISTQGSLVSNTNSTKPNGGINDIIQKYQNTKKGIQDQQGVAPASSGGISANRPGVDNGSRPGNNIPKDTADFLKDMVNGSWSERAELFRQGAAKLPLIGGFFGWLWDTPADGYKGAGSIAKTLAFGVGLIAAAIIGGVTFAAACVALVSFAGFEMLTNFPDLIAGVGSWTDLAVKYMTDHPIEMLFNAVLAIAGPMIAEWFGATIMSVFGPAKSAIGDTLVRFMANVFGEFGEHKLTSILPSSWANAITDWSRASALSRNLAELYKVNSTHDVFNALRMYGDMLAKTNKSSGAYKAFQSLMEDLANQKVPYISDIRRLFQEARNGKLSDENLYNKYNQRLRSALEDVYPETFRDLERSITSKIRRVQEDASWWGKSAEELGSLNVEIEKTVQQRIDNGEVLKQLASQIHSSTDNKFIIQKEISNLNYQNQKLDQTLSKLIDNQDQLANNIKNRYIASIEDAQDLPDFRNISTEEIQSIASDHAKLLTDQADKLTYDLNRFRELEAQSQGYIHLKSLSEGSIRLDGIDDSTKKAVFNHYSRGFADNPQLASRAGGLYGMGADVISGDPSSAPNVNQSQKSGINLLKDR